MAAFNLGKRLKENDLALFVTNPLNPTQRIDATTLSYNIYQVDVEAGTRTQVLPANRTPARFDVGWYFVDEQVDPLATVGEYEVEWVLRRTPTSTQELVTKRYSIVGLERITQLTMNDIEAFLVGRLRILLRDNNPDRYYHFQPPTSDATIQGYTEKYGFIWKDDELLAFLQFSITDINMRPPRTGWHLENAPRDLLALIMVGAAKYALGALETMWIGEEFNYSINGISLDIDKAAKYSAQKDHYTQQFEIMATFYKSTIKIVRGLAQPRYSVGLASHLGPFGKQGIQSLRNFAFGSGGKRPQY